MGPDTVRRRLGIFAILKFVSGNLHDGGPERRL